ncbi:MAG: hypothetical protein ACE5F9_01260 [Phycisphaerae bacterium]
MSKHIFRVACVVCGIVLATGSIAAADIINFGGCGPFGLGAPCVSGDNNACCFLTCCCTRTIVCPNGTKLHDACCRLCILDCDSCLTLDASDCPQTQPQP